MNEAYKQLIEIAKLIEENYGLELISSNIHLSLHIRQCCLDYGPPYAYWCYSFKRMNSLLGSYLTSNQLIEPELIYILMKNMQVEYRISLVNRKDSELPLDKVLSLLNKKVHGSLRMTENFKSEDLIAYINMMNKINTNIITGSERYPGEMIKPIYENVHLPENVYQNLKDYYTTLYELISLSIDKVATQFGRLKLGSEIYGSKIASSYVILSYIRAKFIAYKGDSVDIYPGQIQFFLQHKYNNNIYHLAYIK